MEMPLVVPRARLRVIDGATARLLKRLGLAPDDARRPEAELLAATDTRDPIDASPLAARVFASFGKSLVGMAAAAEPLGPGVPTAFEKTHATVAAALRRLTAKIALARRHADRDAAGAVRRPKPC